MAESEKYLETHEKLNFSAMFIVESGIKLVNDAGYDALTKKLREQWGVQLWVIPRINDDRYLALFRIKRSGINYDIHLLLFRKFIPYQYGYWVIKYTETQWSGGNIGCRFLVTRAKEDNSTNEIITTSEKFAEVIDLGGGVSMEFPTNDARLIYDMEPYKYHNAYNLTKLYGARSHINSNKEYEIDK